jgi:hypothetical protein
MLFDLPTTFKKRTHDFARSGGTIGTRALCGADAIGTASGKRSLQGKGIQNLLEDALGSEGVYCD